MAMQMSSSDGKRDMTMDSTLSNHLLRITLFSMLNI